MAVYIMSAIHTIITHLFHFKKSNFILKPDLRKSTKFTSLHFFTPNTSSTRSVHKTILVAVKVILSLIHLVEPSGIVFSLFAESKNK